ncbi:hypothetical protein LMG28614_03566 [Paraburkholderia ultramafica]|uniref:Uncharacterized protein n=1 Tax=Paraburkholderia ultramafica TaxID=1544867 RepID=A0A6S7B9V0_9BURK|nr:hypothetical protein LMG28614_03566 [Paraburkholderia ultramafica]
MSACKRHIYNYSEICIILATRLFYIINTNNYALSPNH